MKRKALTLLTSTALCACVALGDETGGAAPPRHITLREAVQLSLKHNHDVRIAAYTVGEKQHAKDVAKSSYFPSIRNDSSFLHLTDSQLIEIEAGSLGAAGGTPIPPVSSVINQGGRNLTTSGTQITQPLTSLLEVRRVNDVAQAELKAAREKAELTENDVTLAAWAARGARELDRGRQPSAPDSGPVFEITRPRRSNRPRDRSDERAAEATARTSGGKSMNARTGHIASRRGS